MEDVKASVSVLVLLVGLLLFMAHPPTGFVVALVGLGGLAASA